MAKSDWELIDFNHPSQTGDELSEPWFEDYAMDNGDFRCVIRAYSPWKRGGWRKKGMICCGLSFYALVEGRDGLPDRWERTEAPQEEFTAFVDAEQRAVKWLDAQVRQL